MFATTGESSLIIATFVITVAIRSMIVGSVFMGVMSCVLRKSQGSPGAEHLIVHRHWCCC